MPIASEISYDKYRWRISKEGVGQVQVHPHPPQGEVESAIPIREYFTLGGDGSTIDMRVDGSTTAQDFYIRSDTGSDAKDKYIKAISIVLVDASMTWGKFANLSALTNGVSIKWRTLGEGLVTVADQLTTNYELGRLGVGQPTIEVNVSGNAEGLTVKIDFAETFGLPFGLRLRPNSEDRMTITINDDLSIGIIEFDCIATGIKI
jgi:hypothetical protein